MRLAHHLFSRYNERVFGLLSRRAKEAGVLTCPSCQTENLDGSQYCDECGVTLAGASSGPRVPSAVGHADDAGLPAAAAGEQLSAGASSVAGRASTTFGEGAFKSSAGRAPQAGSAGRAAPHASLVIQRGVSVGKEFPLSEDETLVGRWDADGGIFPDVDLDADDPEAKVSRRHARITRRAGQYFIEDLGSTNGTFINRGRRLLPGDPQPLRDGDEVIVGKTFLRFSVNQ